MTTLPFWQFVILVVFAFYGVLAIIFVVIKALREIAASSRPSATECRECHGKGSWTNVCSRCGPF
jgi:hypothetical protein